MKTNESIDECTFGVVLFGISLHTRPSHVTCHEPSPYQQGPGIPYRGVDLGVKIYIKHEEQSINVVFNRITYRNAECKQENLASCIEY